MRDELVPEEVLQMAKNGLLGDFSLSMSNINSPAIIGFGMVKDKYNLPDDYLKTYPERLKSITAEDIRKAAQKYIKPYECLVFIEGKVEDIKGTLEKFGEVEYYTSDGKRIL
jgi:predicted Zn-dependent peptidase